MTQSCTKCRRPAKASARRCLYCGAGLDAASDGLSTTLGELPPVASADDGPDDGQPEWMVMLTPPPGEPDPLVPGVARALRADPYIVRLRLRRGKPFLGAGGLLLAEAQGMREELSRLGIAASAFTDSMLAAIPDALDVLRGELRHEGVWLALRGGGELELPYAAIFLVVHGEVSERTREVTTRDMFVTPTHGLQRAEQKVKEVTHARRLRVVVDIYHTMAAGALRLDEDGFRVAGGAGDSARASLIDFVQELRRRAPNEVFDASFGELDSVDSTVKSRKADGAGNRARETTVQDNQGELDAYSQALFLHVLKLRRGV